MRLISLAALSALALLVGCSTSPDLAALHATAQSEALAYSAPLPATPPAAAEDKPFNLAMQPNDLKVMTFNLRVPFVLDAWNFWTFRRDLIVKTVDKFNPDLLGTQECPNSSARYLRSKLTAYDFIGVGRDDGKLKGEMCGMFYRHDRFTKLNEGTFWLSNTPNKPGSTSWGNGTPRIVSWVCLQPKDGTPAFCWFNTHFDNASGNSRLQSAKLLRSAVKQIAGSMPIVITGDFNTDQHTAPYEALVGGRPGIDTNLYDAFRLANPVVHDDEGTMHNFHGGKNGPRIDWILTNAGFQPLDVEIDHTQRGPQFPSDHFPVEAIIRMNTPTNYAKID